ncbi:hypothetical protein [Pelomonas sp. SE-A7]|uniref:hypothetical protein n=1 Tax=Pelomonas sp. SE-A7 TaxID=3054953 RepID=UPI00259CD848|nr:hypothetical protein [Pelomonas sp. SE-A7]MDM4766927.1 hypothetical protein [Pelomonas sp. SE-A7]
MPSVYLIRRTHQSLIRAGTALAQEGHWQLCGQTEQVREAAGQVRLHRPEVLACDLRLLDGNATRLLRELQSQDWRPLVLLLTPASDDLLLFETLRSGGDGYCIDTGSGATLSTALDQLHAGRAAMSPMIARQLLAAFGLTRSQLQLAQCVASGQDLSPAAGNELLSQADQHLLSLVAGGLLTEEIAQRWQLGSAEVEMRFAGLYRQLHRLPQQAAALHSA